MIERGNKELIKLLKKLKFDDFLHTPKGLRSKEDGLFVHLTQAIGSACYKLEISDETGWYTAYAMTLEEVLKLPAGLKLAFLEYRKSNGVKSSYKWTVIHDLEA